MPLRARSGGASDASPRGREPGVPAEVELRFVEYPAVPGAARAEGERRTQGEAQRGACQGVQPGGPRRYARWPTRLSHAGETTAVHGGRGGETVHSSEPAPDAARDTIAPAVASLATPRREVAHLRCPLCGELCPAFRHARAGGPRGVLEYRRQVGRWRAEDAIRLRRRWRDHGR